MFTVHKKQKTTKNWKKKIFLSANQRWVVFNPIGLKGLKEPFPDRKHSSLQLVGWSSVWGRAHSEITSPTKSKLTGKSKKLGLEKIPWAQRVKKYLFGTNLTFFFTKKGFFAYFLIVARSKREIFMKYLLTLW